MNFYTNTTSKPVIIGIDHGYGNIKTAHTCFKTGVSAYDKEPTFKNNLLIYEGRFYQSHLKKIFFGTFIDLRPFFGVFCNFSKKGLL